MLSLTITTLAQAIDYMPVIDYSVYEVDKVAQPSNNALLLDNITPGYNSGVIGVGLFHMSCGVSHQGRFDPWVSPGVLSMHDHTFLGNTSIDEFSDLNKLIRPEYTSTCDGGGVNKSSYWFPSMVKPHHDKVLHPGEYERVPVGVTIVYYKSHVGYGLPDTTIIQNPPTGLRVLGGNPTATDINTVTYIDKPSKTLASYFECTTISATGAKSVDQIQTDFAHIPNCKGSPDGKSTYLSMKLVLPSCYDSTSGLMSGTAPTINSHMIYPVLTTISVGVKEWRCPSTHTTAIPRISFNVRYYIPAGQSTLGWRLSSDNYPYKQVTVKYPYKAATAYKPEQLATTKVEGNGGFSAHSDWVNGWQENYLQAIIDNCLNPNTRITTDPKRIDCSIIGVPFPTTNGIDYNHLTTMNANTDLSE
jgi:hypothetical protein